MGRSDFPRRGTCDDVLHCICWLFNASEPYNRYLNGSACLVYQPDCYRFYGCARQPPRRTTEAGPSAVCIYTQSRVGVGDHEGVRSSLLSCLGYKSNISNNRGELYPKWALAGPLCSRNNLADKLRAGTIFDAAALHIGAGDIQLVRRQPFCILQDTNHLNVLRDGLSEDVGNDGCIETA